jgi:hypothetical protein
MDDEQIQGLDAVDRILEQFGAKAMKEAGALVHDRGEAVALDSKQNYVPVDQSTLQGTIHAEPPVIEGNQASVRIVAGGPAADYAEAVHEHLSEHSPASWKIAEASGRGVHFTQGGPKYLERPFLIAIKDLASYVATGLKQRLGT